MVESPFENVLLSALAGFVAEYVTVDEPSLKVNVIELRAVASANAFNQIRFSYRC
jgi:hypothetical protein